ncbi:MAG: FAD-dependent oxidoreductase, partial [Terriglobia bacterium]
MEKLRPDSGIVDVAIIGGGPAGTAAALEARRQGLSVAVWERDRFPRDKVCGEFISPEAL